MLKLGHIEYSNCYPVHALLLEEPQPGVELVTGTPAELNEALATGRIDVAPCSSIEYARHPERYRIVPGFAIGSRGAVGSILLESEVPPEDLDGRRVCVPTASASSVVLLRLLLERRWGVRPRYEWFDQRGGPDPLEGGAAAALRIGDIALRRRPAAGRRLLDLGAAWTDWTGLPFAFAVWQASAGPARDAELAGFAALLARSLAYFESRAPALAEARAERFGLTAAQLLEYWGSLRYRLDDEMQTGLLRFYEWAAELDECAPVRGLRFAPAAP